MKAATTALWCAGLCASILFTSPNLAHPADSGNPAALVRIHVGEDRAEVQRLMQLGYDVAGVDLESGTVDILVQDPMENLSLAIQGFKVHSTHAIDTSKGPDADYKNPSEIEAMLRQFAEDYPTLARLESIGQSLEGRDIWALKITDNPDLRELDEPTILFNAMHHAREVMTPEVALDTIEMLLTSYGTDAGITRWVDTTEIWVVPMLNPDGNNKVWSSNSMWRKNTRNGHGVDINRNYPYRWNSCSGSSGNTSSETYRGASAGSEPETQALMNLVERIQPVFNISYHSYSELVLYPYGCRSQRSETRDIVEPIGKEMAALLPRDTGRGTYTPGTPWELLYSVDGGDIDWMYNVHHVIPYVIELNSSSLGFQPPYRWRQPTVEKMRAAWMLLFEKLEGSGVRGVVTDGAGRARTDVTLNVESMGTAGMSVIHWQVKSDGTFHVILKPGMYRLTFATADKTQTHEVTVGEQRVDLNVEM